MNQTIREKTFTLLRKLGITKIFGNPGSLEETFLQDFPKDFEYIEGLQENSVVAMADGYAQATRKVGLINVHSGAGLTNAMNAIQTAFLSKTPLIITAGNHMREMLLTEPWLANINAEEVPRPYVKWSYQPVDVQDVPAAFMRAYAMALQPPAGPVFLSIPLDDWNTLTTSKNAFKRSVATRVAPDPTLIEEFGKILSKAVNPVLIYGADIARSEGWDDGIALAEKLDVPVWAAPASERAPFPETHPLYMGGLPFAKTLLAKKLEGHDVALVIGAPVFRYYGMSSGDSYIPESLHTLLHVTDNPFEAGAAPVGYSLLSNAKLALQSLIKIVEKNPKKIKPNIIKQPYRMAAYMPVKTQIEEGTLAPLVLFETLRKSTPKNAILMEESPSNLAFLHKAWPIEFADSFYTFSNGSLGWNLPGAVGIALAQKHLKTNRPVVCVLGDGAFQYTLQALWTAVQNQLPILYVVLQNNEYAVLKSFADVQKNKCVPGLNISSIDIVSLSKGYGCNAVKTPDIETIKQVCKDAFTKNVPTVLVVPTEKYTTN